MSINSLHSHLDLLSLQRCLFLQTLASNLYLALQVASHSMCLILLAVDTRLNTLRFMGLLMLEILEFQYYLICFYQAKDLLCLFFLFLVICNSFFMISVVKENTRVKLTLAIPARTLITLAKRNDRYSSTCYG